MEINSSFWFSGKEPKNIFMRLLKRLNAYNKEEINDAYIGFGIIRAKDYERDKYGHLILFSINIKAVSFIKKFFIAI